MEKFRLFIIFCLLSCLIFFSHGAGFISGALSQPPIAPVLAAAVAYNSFPVGPGGADVIPHQIVRTAGDRLYIFGYKGAFSSTINAYWTTSTGLPDSTTKFSTTSLVETNYPLSVEVAYNGSNIIHVLANTVDGKLNDHVFDTASNTFKATFSIATGNPVVAGDYIGTSGLSAMVGPDGLLNIAFWSAGKNITYQVYTYNDQTLSLTLVAGSTQQIAGGGSANHPALAISPLNGSITVAWVSEANNAPKILARTRSGGSWGGVETVSAATPWTSTAAGINIDQGPSLVIDSAGTKHLAYIENYDRTGDYGRIHYATNSGAGWVDTALAAYTHDPALAINSLGEVYIIGHGHANNTTCTSNLDMCVSKKNADNSWGSPALFAAHTGNNSFDTSPSVKWSVVGYNRPETIEFIVPLALNQNYSTTTLYYGAIISGSKPSPTPTLTPTHSPTPTVNPTPTATPTPTPTTPPTPPTTLEVTSNSDTGNISLAGTLSYALNKATGGQTITFNLAAGNTITISGKIPPLNSGVRLRYMDNKPGASCAQPVTLEAANLPGGANLVLSGQNKIEGLIIHTNPPGPGIRHTGVNNSISCTKVMI
jgi:hypothetical protein